MRFLRHAWSIGSWLSVFLVSNIAIAEDRGDWQHFGSDLGGSQYSAINQIDRSNVSELEPAWTHRSGDYEDGVTSLQVTPIHANGALYYCTPMNRVFALDPITGEERWVFDPHTGGRNGEPVVDVERVPLTCRGVAYWEDAVAETHDVCAKRVFKNDFHGHVYAIDEDNHSYKRETINVSAVLQDSIDHATKRLNDADIGVESPIAKTAILVEADATKLERVFSNLIEHTLRYINSSGRLVVLCVEKKRSSTHRICRFCTRHSRSGPAATF